MEIFRRKETEQVTLLDHARLPLVAMATSLLIGVGAGFSLASGVAPVRRAEPRPQAIAVAQATPTGIGGPRIKQRAARVAGATPSAVPSTVPSVVPSASPTAVDLIEQVVPGANKPPKKKEAKDHKPKQRKAAKKVPNIAPVKKHGKIAYTLPVDEKHIGRVEVFAPHHDYPAWDLGIPYGTAVEAVVPGKVVDTTKRSACGRGVVIRDKRGFTWTYCHGRRTLVRPGVKVGAGRKIMKSGSTGNSTGPHLHLQVTNPWGRLLCPQKLLAAYYEEEARSPRDVGSTGCAYRNWHHRRTLMQRARDKAKTLKH